MIELILATVPILKGLHIAGLTIWCGGLLALPLMLGRHHPGMEAEDYDLIRRAVHTTYTMCVTPAAVIAVIAGTWLIFTREAFVPWLYAKLAFVALLVLVHAWFGHLIVQAAEEPQEHTPPKAYLLISAALVPVIAILFLVLAKPALGWISFPDLLLEPRNNQLLFDVPRR